MTMPEMEQDEEYRKRQTQKERLLAANREAARFYHETLYAPAGAASLAYLRGRGLTDGVIRQFGLGAAPNGWTVLTDHLLKKGWSLRELSQAGLTSVKTGEDGKQRYYDIFRNRAMFPIIDARGNVLAFGGRALEKNVDRKYLNTSDTPVFNKRLGVYAANLLHRQRHLDRVVLVEGYMDVVSLTQFGVEGVVATLGTAFTPEQARLLKRYAPRVFLAYDGDSAGQHAILRGLSILEQEGIPAMVLDFPDGLDPDEFIRRDGAEGFRALPALSPAAYRLRREKERFDLSKQDGRLAYARAGCAILAGTDRRAGALPWLRRRDPRTHRPFRGRPDEADRGNGRCPGPVPERGRPAPPWAFPGAAGETRAARLGGSPGPGTPPQPLRFGPDPERNDRGKGF